MIRLLLILLQISFLVGFFLLLRYHTGTTTMQAFDVRITLHTSLLIIGILIFGLVIYWFTACWHKIQRFFERRHHVQDLKKWENALDDLLKAENADLKGQNRIPYLEKSADLGKNHPYIQFLKAKSYLDKGESQKAESDFQALLQEKDSRFKNARLPALYGLIAIAKAANMPELVFTRSKEALELAPAAPSIHREILEVCLKNPDLTDRFEQQILPIFERHRMSKDENIRQLYTEWLLRQSRQTDASSHLITGDLKAALKLASKAFELSPDNPLAFERIINSLITHGKPRDLRKAGKLMQQHWHQFASLGLGRTYRDVILKEKPRHKKIQAFRALLKAHIDTHESSSATTMVLLAETLVDNGIWGEAATILEKLDKKQELSHREIRSLLQDKIRQKSEHHRPHTA